MTSTMIPPMDVDGLWRKILKAWTKGKRRKARRLEVLLNAHLAQSRH